MSLRGLSGNTRDTGERRTTNQPKSWICDAGDVLPKERGGDGPKILRLAVARDLDAKIEALLEAAAR